MSVSPFPVTKITFPLVHAHLPPRAVIERLNHGSVLQLMLLSAGAGFGETALQAFRSLLCFPGSDTNQLASLTSPSFQEAGYPDRPELLPTFIYAMVTALCFWSTQSIPMCNMKGLAFWFTLFLSGCALLL